MRMGRKRNRKQICVGRHAIAIAEAHDRDEHGALVWIFETLGDEVAEFVDVELRTVDDDVGELRWAPSCGVPGGGFAHGNIFTKRVRAARLAVAAQERIFCGIDEHQGKWDGPCANA